MRRARLPIALALGALAARTTLAQDQTTTTAATATAQAKADADLRTAQAGAKKAEADAAVAQQSAYTSLVTAAGSRGTYTVNTGAGVAETASAAAETAATISQQLKPELDEAFSAVSPSAAEPEYCAKPSTPRKGVIFVSDPWRPDRFLITTVYASVATRVEQAGKMNTRVLGLVAAFKTDIANAPGKAAKATGGPGKPTSAGGFIPALAVAGISAIAAAAKTDIDMYGVAITAGDAMLIRALAGQYQHDHRDVPVYLPTIVSPERGASTALSAKFVDLHNAADTMQEGQTQLIDLTAQLSSLQADAGDKTLLAAEYARITKNVTDSNANLTAMITSDQTWLTAMEDQSKGQSLEQLAGLQGEIACVVADGALIVQAKAEVLGGSIYTRKNLWTTFGGTPIFVSAGGVVSVTFWDAGSLTFLGSGLVRGMSPWRPIISQGPRGSVTKIGFGVPSTNATAGDAASPTHATSRSATAAGASNQPH